MFWATRLRTVRMTGGLIRHDLKLVRNGRDSRIVGG